MDAERARDGANEIWGHFPAQAQPEQSASDTAVRITSVRWGRTVNLGNYESARLEVEADVPTGGSPESTLEQLQAWVDERSPMTPREEDRYIAQRNRLRNEIQDLDAKVGEARRIWRNTEAWMAANNIKLAENLSEDLPF